jgi:putative addiction module killer protein
MVLEIREYLSSDGASPFARWRRRLDAQVRARIDAVIERFVDGNFGDHKGVGDGVQEARVHAGPGYRIYYGLDGVTLVILLAAGTKASQERDIEKARARWKDYKERKQRGE